MLAVLSDNPAVHFQKRHFAVEFNMEVIAHVVTDGTRTGGTDL